MANRSLDEVPVGDEKLNRGGEAKRDPEGQDVASPIQDYDVERVEKVYR